MSAPVADAEQAVRRLTAERVRAAGRSPRVAGRSRRADAGALTEMTRALLRDAREVGAAEARCRQGAAACAQSAVRDERAPSRGRLTPRAFAARPA
jgi:hypothetical protein